MCLIKNIIITICVIAAFDSVSTACESCGADVLPVEIKINVEKERILFDIQNNALYWRIHVFGEDIDKISSKDEGLRLKAQKYINEHLIVTIDGRVSAGRVESAGYIQNLWADIDKASVRMKVSYGIDQARTGTIKLYSAFFDKYAIEDYRHDQLEQFPDKKPYLAKITISTGKKGDFELPIDKPEIEISLADYLQTTPQKMVNFFGYGLRVFFDSIIFLLFLVLWVLSGRPLKNIMGPTGFLCLFILAGIIISSRTNGFSSVIACAAVTAGCAWSYYFFDKPALIQYIFISAGLPFGIFMTYLIRSLYLHTSMDVISIFSYWTAVVLVVFAAVIVEIWLLAVYKSNLKRRFESVSELKYNRTVRFLLVLGGVISSIIFINELKLFLK